MIPQAELVLFGPPSEPWYKRVALARRYRKGWQRVASGDSDLRWTGGSRLTPEGALYVQEIDLRDGCLQLFAGSSSRTSLDSREYSYGVRRDVRGAYVELHLPVAGPGPWLTFDVCRIPVRFSTPTHKLRGVPLGYQGCALPMREDWLDSFASNVGWFLETYPMSHRMRGRLQRRDGRAQAALLEYLDSTSWEGGNRFAALSTYDPGVSKALTAFYHWLFQDHAAKKAEWWSRTTKEVTP